jgi:DNA-directed RNA polymerase specialized sigma24 family protein
MTVSLPSPSDAWVRRLLEEGKALAVVVLYLTRHGDVPARARDRAEEALEEALSKLITQTAEGFFDYRHFENTVIRTAIRCAIDDYRKWRKMRSLAGQSDHLATPPSGLRAWSPLVRRCLEQLPDDQRRLLELHFEEGYTLDEMADHLLPPDQRSDNARRLEVWRRLRGVLRQVRADLLAQGLVLPGEMAGHEPTS